MTEAIRTLAWGVLREGFESIRRALQNNIPPMTMRAGCYHNDAFLFRAYAEYTHGERTLVISFDIQVAGQQLHIWGNASAENGLILADIMDKTIPDEGEIENRVVESAARFASSCKEHLHLIKTFLQ